MPFNSKCHTGKIYGLVLIFRLVFCINFLKFFIGVKLQTKTTYYKKVHFQAWDKFFLFQFAQAATRGVL